MKWFFAGSGLWLYSLTALAAIILSTFVGLKFGQRARQLGQESDLKSQLGTIQGSMLGLLALLLGFTFSMSLNRFDTRRQIILNEANAVGTTYLRAQFLPKPENEDLMRMLERYTDNRVAFYKSGADVPEASALEQQARALQAEMWKEAASLMAANPQSIAIGLFITSLNEMIDLGATRALSLQTHLPPTLLIFVWIVSCCNVAMLGYSDGILGVRNPLAIFGIPLFIAATISLISDLDRPRIGLLTVGQIPMLDLQQSMKDNP